MMSRAHILRILLVAALLSLPLRGVADQASSGAVTAVPAKPAWVFDNVARIVAVGDIHGDYEKFRAVLSLCKLTDESGHWNAGPAHLVQTGDVLDRGPDSKKVIEHLMQLEREALAAGGRVHALIGNHEYMTMMGDLRYASDGELRAFGEGPRGTPVGRIPIGDFPRYREAFSVRGPLGRWIVGHNAIVKINGTLFLHGGLSPKYAQRSPGELNELVRAELRGERDAQTGVGADPEGPLWFRGLAESAQPQLLETFLSSLLSAQRARRIVMGHTMQEQGVSVRAGGRLVLIDVGMSKMALDGKPACLTLTKPTASAPEQLAVVP